MTEPVQYDVDGAVATITLNRPEALNAFDRAMKRALRAALDRARDPAIRAVVLTGAGRAFCAGQDLREHAELLAADDGSIGSTVREDFNPMIMAIASMPKPVVAAIGGMAAGAGASLAFAADFRIAADSAAFLLAFARVGLSADSGASWTLQRLVGYGRATALLMLAEPVSAQAALEMGLVNAVVPAADTLAAAGELAERLAAGPTAAYAAIKASLAYAANADLPSALEREAQLQVECGGTADHRAATGAFLRKEQPVYTGH